MPGRATLCQVVPMCATGRELRHFGGPAVVPGCARSCQDVTAAIAHSIAHSGWFRPQAVQSAGSGRRGVPKATLGARATPRRPRSSVHAPSGITRHERLPNTSSRPIPDQVRESDSDREKRGQVHPPIRRRCARHDQLPREGLGMAHHRSATSNRSRFPRRRETEASESRGWAS